VVEVLVNGREANAPAPRLGSVASPTPVERSYLEQGYVLPGGCTWEIVAEQRARWDIAAIFVPVTVAPGCVGWGVPFIDGRPLEHS
jgi:hypothetical protein